MRLTIAYSKIKKINLVLINNDTHQRETVSERPIRPLLSMLRALHSAASNMGVLGGVHSFKILSDFSQNVKLYIFVYGRTTNYR